jgi:NAD(P)-dependent dehydrogenase (short-subunit alcohol dehydrogenase family)
MLLQVVVSAPPSGLHPAGTGPNSHSSKSSVAITGGSGGLGLLMAQWLATSGSVREVHLFSRAGRLPSSAAAAPAGLLAGDASGDSVLVVEPLQQYLLGSGVSVSLHAADVSFSSDLRAVTVDGSYCSWGQQGGIDVVLHAAGVLQDSLISNQSQSSIRAAMAPKLGAAGAANMAAAAAGMPLQQLVLFSSVASTVGAAGQGNYVSANAVLDGWAPSGRQQGCNISSVQWGAWATAGG